MMELFPSFSKKYFTIKCLLTYMNGCIGSLNSHLTCWSLLQTFFCTMWLQRAAAGVLRTLPFKMMRTRTKLVCLRVIY
ncbi:26S proteasome non-ATPase regulatory subunit 1-like protein A-like [Iris pallida]|uniref:26S proteasome non-ATPase regulatory subunit 1-like protein A-like n=1 Tax=Iris pallida TaxID=29817 RepID=A0AAX6HQG2_IRIPA|nr:26S proteasome non-ATPase regulatory subunit 1-like protein A-like [Iris pallida]